MEPNADITSCSYLSVDDGVVAIRIQIEMVSRCRDTSLQHLTDADLSTCVDSLFVNVLPVFIEERQPVEQLGMFDLGNIPKQRLIEVMVSIDKTRHHQHARARDGAVCRDIEDWRPCANGHDDVVVNDNIRILKFLPNSIAHHKEGNVSDKRSHMQPPLVVSYCTAIEAAINARSSLAFIATASCYNRERIILS